MSRSIVCLVLTIITALSALSAPPGEKSDRNREPGTQKPGTELPQGKKVDGVRRYTLVVNEGNDSVRKAFNRGLEEVRGNMDNRGFGDILVNLYKTTASGQAVSITQQLIDVAIGSLTNSLRSKQPDWEKAVRNESRFERRLPMQMEILDFYARPSKNGPLDPTDMNFNGFACGQEVEYIDSEGNPQKETVFYVACRMDSTAGGKARMLNHSKFNMVVDTLIFNYTICDLPNDSLGMDIDTRIPFSFEDRMDLRFNLKAQITSSWINEAMMVYNDEKLGEFNITALIEENSVDPDGVFRYYAGSPESKDKKVSITGDCFLVPRSYTGGTEPGADTWGTGQYKVEMQVTESCQINPGPYREDKNKWKGEWKQIKKRRKMKGKSMWRQMLDVVTNQYTGQKWVTVLTEPMKTAFIQYETDGISRLLNPGMNGVSGGKSQGGQPGDRK